MNQTTMNSPEVYYTKWCHGGGEVRVLNTTEGKVYELLNSSSLQPQPPKIFKSARSLLIEIHGGKDNHITFDKYFKVGQSFKPQSEVTVLDIFGGSFETHTKKTPKINTKPIGIDLVNRGHEVAKLFYAGFGSEVIQSGYDPEDVLQEVYKGLIARNHGECPFDPSKGSFGHYVHMVCSGIVNNIHRKENKRKGREVVGLPTFVNGTWENADVSVCETIGSEPDMSFSNLGLSQAIRNLENFIESGDVGENSKPLMKKMIPLLLAGHTQKEIMDILGLSKAGLRKTLGLLREEASDWEVWS